MSIAGSISILWLGDASRDEFREARVCLDRFGSVTEAGSVDEAVALITSIEVTPALVVIAQSYPGQFSSESLDHLRRVAPLARLIGLLGSWCEGEVRTGHPWPATVRFYWHQWTAQCGRELEALLLGQESAWSLPSTATDEERLLAVSPRPSSGHNGLIAVCAQAIEAREWLATACRRPGYSTVHTTPDTSIPAEGAVAGVFDMPATTESQMASLEHFCGDLGPHIPVIALLNFPRIEDQRRALAAGAAAVLSKPLLIADLEWRLDQLIGQ
jgi:DNA-binding NarL/FixJ family response regulator